MIPLADQRVKKKPYSVVCKSCPTLQRWQFRTKVQAEFIRAWHMGLNHFHEPEVETEIWA